MIFSSLPLLIIDLFGTDISVAEITAVIGGISCLAGFLIYYRSEKLKRDAQARDASLTADTKEFELIKQIRERDVKMLNDLQDIQRVHIDDLSKKEAQIRELINAQKQTEATFKKRLRTFEEKFLQFRRLMNKLHLPYWETDINGDLVYVNGEWLKLFGMTLEEAAGRNWQSVVNKSDIRIMEIEGDAQKIDGDDTGTPVFTIHNKSTGESYKVRAVYVMVKENKKVVEQFGVTVKIDGENGQK